ncbi:DUF1206 domain-containing protein [Nodosilinea sp. LEGE 06152]|uniref:DUF1206 domain-containing protein n=1 Tax=Nodosilinea sp. LEGE 06152 TaxID=2777966 RepID=UPI00187E4F0E|nr:DUF1206 domain-containing protein [Nodosilinea sp. LEGE 06152]MBE9156283.1 DUF1206 domain-containing protein [Nodosilinea sp. LEGE 06152]
MRLGHGAKGTFYGLIGLFAINDIIHDQPIVAGSEAVLADLDSWPLGSAVLGLLAFGLMGYVLWRLLQASIDPGQAEALSLRQVLQRCGYLVSGLTYLGIAQSAAKLALNLAVDFDDTIEELVSVLFEQDVGPWMLIGVGLGVVAVGCLYIYGAASGGYINDFHRDLSRPIRRWVVVIGKVGITARGVGFVLIGAYLIKAAYLVDNESAGGLGNVFDELDDEFLGEYWLGAIALGFLAYAVYMIIAACYRQFPTVNPSPRAKHG